MACRVTIQLMLLMGVTAVCASCGPHMLDQISVKPYKQKVPAMPAGVVPTAGRLATATEQVSKTAQKLATKTATTLDDGRIYYGYYCVQCHGTLGDGNGPVGQSYDPKPTDLTSRVVAALTDGQLYYGMLHGVGHDPVMDQTVLPQHRWAIVAYVRSLGR